MPSFLTAGSFERRGAAVFSHALAPSFLSGLARTAEDDTDCPFGRRYQTPHAGTLYTWQSRRSRLSGQIFT